MIRVLIVDDQRLMREGLKTLLELEPDLHVAGMACHGEEAVHAILARPVDVVLMDIRMPVCNGIEATRRINERWPEIRVLMLTTYEEKDDVVGALSAGAVGYLLKDMPAGEISAAVRTAYSGGAVLPPGIARTFLSAVQEQGTAWAPSIPEDASGEQAQGLPRASGTGQDAGLTERERDVLHCLAQGMSNREIGQALHVTEGTVKNHMSSLIDKLGLRDRTQAALYAVRHGYGQISESSP